MDRTDVIGEAEQLPKKMWNPVQIFVDHQTTLAHVMAKGLEQVRDQQME